MMNIERPDSERFKVKRLGHYVYEIYSLSSPDQPFVGCVSVSRCTDRSQRYQILLNDGTVLKEFSSVRKAALAALERIAGQNQAEAQGAAAYGSPNFIVRKTQEGLFMALRLEDGKFIGPADRPELERLMQLSDASIEARRRFCEALASLPARGYRERPCDADRRRRAHREDRARESAQMEAWRGCSECL